MSKPNQNSEAREAAAQQEQVDRWLTELVQAPVPALPDTLAEQLAQRILAPIDGQAQAIAARRRRARKRRGMVVAAALAAALGATVVVGRRWADAPAARVTSVEGLVQLEAHGRRTPLVRSESALAPNDALETQMDARAQAALATGAQVEVGPATRVRFAPRGSPRGAFDDAIVLDRGAITVSVPRLAPGTTLTVRTSDATVTVHGTRFVVEHAEGSVAALAETRVAVREGRVSVRTSAGQRWLGAGERWSSRINMVHGDTRDHDNSAAVVASADTASTAGVIAPTIASTMKSTGTPRSESNLAVENDALEHAMDARRRGNTVQAVQEFDHFLRHFPSSPLAETARVERMRALVSSGDKRRAATEARRYLADFPRGFALDEAKAILTPPGVHR